jgi:multidrug efflux system outer membrane protein
VISDLIVQKRGALRRRARLRMIIIKVATSVLLTLAGCMVGPNYRTPTVELPPHWSNLEEQRATGGTRIDLAQWWRSFNDPLLNEIIVQALSSNLDEKIALSRVHEERANLVISHAGLFPTLDLDGSYTRQRYSANTPFGEFPQLVPREENMYEAGFDASWELDVFGGKT